jgi:hypothetical protein
MAGIGLSCPVRRLVCTEVVLAVCACQVATLFPAPANAQILDQLRDDVRTPGPKFDRDDRDSSKRRHREYDDCCEDDDGYDGLTELAAWVTLYTVTSPIWIPRSVVNDESLMPGYYARYPYWHDLPGYMATSPEDMAQLNPSLAEEHYDWLLRTRVEYAASFNDLSRIGGQVLLDTASRWGLDTEFDYLHEDRNGGREDSLWLGDANVVFRFAQSPKLQMRTGLGLNWLSDQQDTDFGFNFTYGGDLFIANPWIMSAEIDWGWLGHAGLFRGRTTLGVQFHRLEVYTGYEYLDVGRTQINSLISGIRLWY